MKKDNSADHYAIPCLDPYSNVKNRIMKVIHVGEDDLNTIFYMPRLEVVDAKEFGHDGLGHYSGDYGDIPKGVQQVSLILNPKPHTINQKT